MAEAAAPEDGEAEPERVDKSRLMSPRRPTGPVRRGAAGRLAKSVAKFLDRIFCQLFHSNEQIQRYVLLRDKDATDGAAEGAAVAGGGAGGGGSLDLAAFAAMCDPPEGGGGGEGSGAAMAVDEGSGGGVGGRAGGRAGAPRRRNNE